ncbi:MAG: FGGY-family carbohydrate kinase [Bacteroides sp.]|nr:FGGY-family carbohydrate kinase [Bacteroides sp.]
MKLDAKSTIEAGKAILGIELGSTRIKAVLIDQENKPIAQGSHTWENQLVDGLWTYSVEAVWYGLQDCYADLRTNVKSLYDTEIETLAAIGVSAMMHGYMAFNEKEEILVPFRTWRNTNTGQAAAALSELFVYNIPLRWSISHLYQAILDNEEHVPSINYLTTLAGFVHWQITGQKVLGIGDASGMLPINPTTKNYSSEMVDKFDKLIAPKGYDWKLRDILPKVLSAGENAGFLTPEGASRLDASGHLKPGIPVCPPEGDAGTGMVATNAVKQRTGNVSAGTSSFSMIVLEKELSKPYEMIDMVTTPDGSLVAMVHCNNCTSDLNAWINIFKEYQELMGIPADMDEIYGKLYNHALTGNADCGGLISYNYISGEPITGLAEGRPLFVRSANDKFNLANFMRAHLYASVGVLKIGNDILFNEEKIRVDRITGHGGLFKTKGVGQRILAAAINSPISVMETAGEGGAWGIALLAFYLANNGNDQSLADFLDKHVFTGNAGIEISPTAEDVSGFNTYIESYKAGLPIEEAAVRFKN